LAEWQNLGEKRIDGKGKRREKRDHNGSNWITPLNPRYAI